MTPAPLSSADIIALLQRLNARSQFVAAQPLAGGVSALTIAVTWRDERGAEQQCVVRQYGAADLAANRHIARDEYHLLRLLHARGLPVPEPLYYDEALPGAGVPVLVQAYVEGTPHPAEPADAVAAHMARALAQVHRVAAADVPFLPLIRLSVPAGPNSDDDAQVLNDLRHAPPATNPSVLLHGDYWPGNVLWRAGKLVAIVDWEDAAVGDPLADVANARLELLWAHGQKAAEAFTAAYQALSGASMAALPYWDLWVALKVSRSIASWGLEPHALATMRSQTSAFMALALSRIPR
jgi:aminoglycoside phosphotransferase (APT) family kinase protein